MTDSTPENYFLIFDRSDEFETQDKISYAVKERDSIHHQHWDVSLKEILRRKLLIRSLEALKYCVKISTLLDGSDSCRSSSVRESSSDESTASILSSTLTCNSQSSGENVQGKEDDDANTCLSRHSQPRVRSKALSRVLPAARKSLEELKTIDAIPWENTGANATEWQWPVEILYQHYHVHVVIDFARAFDVSHNGHVFYDRIPDVVQCLMTAVKTALHHRVADTKEIAEWLENASGLSKEMQKKALQQVWNPNVLVSITLINVPWHGDGRVPDKKEKWKPFLKLAQEELVSPEMKNFSSYESTKSSIVSILTRFDVNMAVEDTELYESFTKKLARTLGEYEKASRELAVTPGTVLSLESSIEYLLRSAPNTSKYCESIILVTNLTNCSCSSAVSCLEGMVQRKNIIFSIATLNREPVLDSPQLCALTLFMSHIGGFVVNIDFWRSLSQIKLNAEWSKRFEGSRCLIQQLFVQLIIRFPRASRLPYISPLQRDSVVVYQKAQTLTLSDQVSCGNNIANAILKALAVARFNENWSVVMYSPCPDGEESNDENEDNGEDKGSKVRQLVARSTHYFHQGSLTLQYELTIAFPFFERRVSVRGTKILVYQFCRADAEARSRPHASASSSSGAADLKTVPSETVGSLPQRGKVSYVENFCLHLREELLGEDVILRLMLKKAYSKQLLHFSCAKGVFYKWFNFAAVRSLAVCYDMSKRKDYSSTPLPSISSEECASRVVKCIESTLEKHNYARIASAEELVFIRHIDYQPYLVQFFPIGSNEEEPFQDYPAGCLECRISFFFWDWKKRYDVVKEMISILSSSSDAYPGSVSYRDNDKIILRTFSHVRSQCLLGAMQELIIPRLELPPVHLSKSVALGISGSVLPMRIPHPSFPFPLKQALTVYWCFSEESIFPAEVRKKCFFFALLRRRQAFDCLLSFGDSLKAILQRKGEMNERGKESGGMELDYIDASGEHATVKVTRIITNVTPACSYLQGDVEQDFKIFSALSTFFDKVSSQTSSSRLRKIEPLLPYIPSELDIVVLPSPKCFGHQGVVQLRQCLKRYLKGLDSSQIVESCLFPPSLVRALQTSGGVASAQLKDVSLSMIVSTKVVVSTNPIQSGSIVFAIMIADDPKCHKKKKEAVRHHQDILTASARENEEKRKLKHDHTSEKDSGSVVSQLVVALVWMNYSRLSQELTSHYRQETSVHAVRNERNAVHISNRRLVEDIRKALSVRVSLHSTLYMLQYFSAVEKKLLSLGQKERSSLDEMEIEDLLDAVSHLTIFVHEITGESMAALHYVVESVVASSFCRKGNQEKKSEQDVSAAINQVLSYLLTQFCKSYIPLSSLWFPREDALGLVESPPSFVSVPVLMKAAIKIQEKGEESRADWISGGGDTPVPNDGVMNRVNRGNPLQNLIGSEGWTDRLTTDKTSLKTFVLRLFMLSSMLDEKSGRPLPQSVYNPVPHVTSQLLDEKPPGSEFFSKRFNGVPLGNVSTTSVGEKLQRLVTVLQNELMGFCLQSCFQHQSYVEMFRLLGEEGEAPLREREVSFSSPSSRLYTRTDYGSNTSGNTTSGLVGVEKKFAPLRHSNVEGCRNVRNTPDLQRLLRQVVLPLLDQTAPSCTPHGMIQDIRSFCSEVVENNTSSTSYKGDALHVAVQEMFQRFKEDGILLLPIQESRHLFVPPSTHAFAASLWILVDVQISTEEMCKVSVLGYAVDSAGVAPTSALCSLLVDYIIKKITQFCQLQILKELRHTQQCSEKLLPSRWGDQFRLGPGERKSGVQSPGKQTSTIASSLQLDGKNVLHLPLYYKLQNQCVCVLKWIGGQCPRLELVPILNQPQCFLVADDNMEDVFHCVRLVFVVDSSSPVLTADPSHTLKETERCPRLVIQLFSAVDNPAVQRPLEKLQRFCYFLALQELQGQLNYANILSFHDALFLQQHRREKLYISYCFSKNASPSEKQEMGNTKGGGTVYGGSSETDGRFALDFVELHLREQDFKFFEVSDDMHSTKSKFLEYYDLQMIEEKTADKVSVVSSKGGKKKEQMNVRRFVKLMEGRNDVLVSCSVHINAAEQCVVLEPYCTKEPQERFTNAESEKSILEELKSCEAGSRVLMQLYFRLPFHRKKVPLTALHFLLEDVLRMSAEVSLTHYCFKSFSLEDISTAVLPFLVERLCGALAPFKPCCLQYLGKECSPSPFSLHETSREENTAFLHEPSLLPVSWRHVASFPWKWIECIQNDPLADEMEFYILCGFLPVVRENGLSVPPTRVAPYIIPKLNLGVSKGTDPRFRTSALNSLEPQLLLKVSMVTESLSIAFFNIRDVHIISTICSRIVEEMCLKSLLLQDLLLQRMGVRPFQSPFSELDLAHHCCGDATNVIENRSLAIDPQLHRRPEKTLRFPPSTSSLVISTSEKPPKEAIFLLLLESLHNRGLVVNHVFPFDDGVKVLFDESLDLTLQQCDALMQDFISAGFIRPEETAALRPRTLLSHKKATTSHPPGNRGARTVNYRVMVRKYNKWTSEAMIACSYQRHLFSAHIIVEAQNAQSSVQDLLSQCEPQLLQGVRDLHDKNELAKTVVLLRSKSQEIFASRVPDFLLLRNCRNLVDDVLEQTLPERSDEGIKHANAVDSILQKLINHLIQVCPSAIVMELDPTCESTLAEPVLISRLRCRYGKVYSKERNEMIRFCPRLHYAVIPLYDLLQAQAASSAVPKLEGILQEFKGSPISSCGLFVVEIGFQVSHYALDVFANKGHLIASSIVASLAADLRCRLSFENMLYDYQVEHIISHLQHSSVTGPSVHPAQESLLQAVSSLLGVYPFAPVEAKAAVAAIYQPCDSLTIRMKFEAKETKEASSSIPFHFLPPDDSSHRMLVSANGHQQYYYCGMASTSLFIHNNVMESATNSVVDTATSSCKTFCLFILLQPVPVSSVTSSLSDASPPAFKTGSQPEDFFFLFCAAKSKLLSVLLRTTREELIEFAWKRFFSISDTRSRLLSRAGISTVAPPTIAEYQFVLSDAVKLLLPYTLQRIQALLEYVDWPVFFNSLLKKVAEEFYSTVVLHVFTSTIGSHLVGEQQSFKRKGAHRATVAEADTSYPEDRGGARGFMYPIVFALAPVEAVGQSFLVAEGWSRFYARDHCFRVDVEEVSIIRRLPQRSDGSTNGRLALTSAGIHYSCGMRDFLSQSENELVSIFQSILTRAIWVLAL